MLSTWLTSRKRSASSFSSFETIDLEESFELGVECTKCIGGVSLPPRALGLRDYLVQALIHSRNDEKFLKDLASYFNWGTIKASIVLPSIPTILTAIHGEFGELLTDLVLVELQNYTIPVPKRWYMITADQTLPGSDTLAIKLGDGKLIEACYVESKLRSTNDTMAAKEAYEELVRKHNQNMPVIVTFTLKRLHEQNSPFLEPFMEYMRDMSVADQRDTFWMGLTWEKSAWSEKVLDNLEAYATSISTVGGNPKCSVHCLIVKDLRALIENVFASVKVA